MPRNWKACWPPPTDGYRGLSLDAVDCGKLGNVHPRSIAVKTAMTFSTASLFLLLAACTPAQPPAAPEAPAAPEPAVPAAPPISSDQPMAKRPPGDTTPPMTVFRAFGTEPFWNINVEDATLTFTTPEDQDGVVMQGERRSLDDGVEITGSHVGKPFTLRVNAGLCSDGMSDNEYELTSSFRYGDIDYAGCGEVAK